MDEILAKKCMVQFDGQDTSTLVHIHYLGSYNSL